MIVAVTKMTTESVSSTKNRKDRGNLSLRKRLDLHIIDNPDGANVMRQPITQAKMRSIFECCSPVIYAASEEAADYSMLAHCRMQQPKRS